DFFRSAIQGEYNKLREVFLSQAAWDEFHAMDSNLQELFINCFNAMRDPQQLEKVTHGKYKGLKTDCIGVKRGQTQERPFYYIQDNKVVVARLTLHDVATKLTVKYEKFIAGGQLYREDHPAHKSVSALHAKKGVLIVPLGQSPMVATQMYTLLTRQAGWKISRLRVIYPEKDTIICKGVSILRQLCDMRSIGFEARPISNLADVDSEQNCMTYRDALIQTIKSVRQHYPNRRVLLSLAAGRKSMSVLTLFAAQYAHVPELFHTLIPDPDYEQHVEQETTLKAVSRLQPNEIARRYFLDTYNLTKFDLFTIPVIPIE
ncbi:MAG: CRISPR-associated ring nuclease, partial [Candidatus Promineifilaceae bacterium]